MLLFSFLTFFLDNKSYKKIKANTMPPAVLPASARYQSACSFTAYY